MIKKSMALIAAIFLSSPTAYSATTLNVPLLTWEAGKQHVVVLAGPGSNGAWKMQFEGENIDPLLFKQTRKNDEGAYLYTVDLPKDLTPGAYVVQAIEEDGTKTIVAGIQVKIRETYRIAQIPSDLKLLAMILAGLATIFAVIRSRKYSHLIFSRRLTPEKQNFFYKFRSQRLASEGDSLARFLALRAGEPLHKLNTNLWAILPWLAVPLGVFTAVKIQFDAAIPNGPIALFFICAILGALDATTGITLSLTLGFMHVALGNVTNLRSLLVAVAFTLSWYFPAMLAALVRLTIGEDFKRITGKANVLISSLVASLAGGTTVAMSTIITDSLVINRQASDLLRWPLAAAVAITIFIKYLFETTKDRQAATEEKLYLARVISPGLASTLFFANLLLVYVWTNQVVATLIASLIMVLPYFLLFVVFPKIGRFKIARAKRNILLETFIVVALTFLAYRAVQSLPEAVIIRSRIFILIGFVPSLLHGIYSVAVASAEYASRAKEEETVQ